MGASDSDVISLSWGNSEELWDDEDENAVESVRSSETAEAAVAPQLSILSTGDAVAASSHSIRATAPSTRNDAKLPRQDPASVRQMASLWTKGESRQSLETSSRKPPPLTSSQPSATFRSTRWNFSLPVPNTLAQRARRRRSASRLPAATTERPRIEYMYDRFSVAALASTKVSTPAASSYRPPEKAASVGHFTQVYTTRNGKTVPLFVPENLLQRLFESGEAKNSSAFTTTATTVRPYISADTANKQSLRPRTPPLAQRVSLSSLPCGRPACAFQRPSARARMGPSNPSSEKTPAREPCRSSSMSRIPGYSVGAAPSLVPPLATAHKQGPGTETRMNESRPQLLKKRKPEVECVAALGLVIRYDVASSSTGIKRSDATDTLVCGGATKRARTALPMTTATRGQSLPISSPTATPCPGVVACSPWPGTATVRSGGCLTHIVTRPTSGGATSKIDSTLRYGYRN